MIDPTLSADDQQTQTIQGSLFLAKDTTPDVASEAVRLGKTLNLPAEFVMRNMDWARSVTPSKQVSDLPLTHPKTAQFLSDPINASVTKDEIERLKVIEDVMREGAAEPGLFSKESRSAVIGALRSQGYKIEEVEQPKGVFSKTLERTAKVLSPQVTELTAPVQFGGVGLPSGVRQTIEQAPVSAPLQAEAPAQQPPVELATQPAGFLETLNRNVARGQFIPFIGGGIEVAEMKDLYDTVRRIGDGSATAKDWIDVLKVDEEIRRGTTFGGKVGTGLAMMPGFIGEMAATSGMATAGRKAAVNAGLATVRKVLNKSTRQVAENLALKSAVELGGWATKSVLVGAAGMPHRVAANALRRRIPALANISEDDAGQLEAFLKEPDESLARSIFKGIAESSIEVGSEFSGGLLGRIGSKLAPAQLDAVKAMVVGRWFKLHPTSGWSQFQQRLKQVQFHGIMAEAGEEVVGDVLTLLSQPVTGLETPDFDIENYLSAAVSAAFIPGAALLRYGPGMIRASNQLAQRAQAQVDFFRDLAEGSVNQKTRERVPGMLATLGDMAAQNGPVETAFASLEKWNAYFESQGIDPRAFAEKVLGSTEAYDRASSTGADLEIPIGAYAEFIAPTEHNEGLMRDMRLGNAAAPTVNEMQAELQSQEAMLDNMVKLSQSSEALQKQAQTLDERIAALTQEATGAEAKLTEIQTRLEQIRARFPQTPAEQLVASLTGQTDSPEMQALATEYDTLTRDAGAIEKQRTDLESLRSERTKVQADIEQVLSEEERFRAAFPSKNPEVEAYAAEVAQNLTATGRYKNERMARVHGNIAARMLYILGLRSGNSLQAMVEKYPIQITAGETDISQALVQAGTLAQGELSARDAEYMAAVEAGDMEKAQRIVDEAANTAGYTTRGYHGTSKEFDTFQPRTAQGWGTGVYFASDKGSAEEYGPRIVTAALKINRPFLGMFSSEDEGKVEQTNAYKQALQQYKNNPRFIDSETGELDWRELYQESGSFAGDFIQDLGYDAVVQKDSPHLPSGSEIVVFEPSQIKSADPVTRDADGNVIPLSERFNPEEKSILFQDSSAELLPRVALKQEQKQIAARGFIQFDPTQRGAGRRPFTIGMLKKANASTFMHEMAHWYLEVSLDIDNTEAAQGDLKADVDAIRKWLGITDAYPTEAQHEVFARGFEKYLMEGVAPSESVRGFFASMRAWMIRIYKDLWHPDLNATLSDDIRRVFDRMLATEEEIDAAQAENSVEPMFMEKPAFMSDDQWERYSKFVSRASMLAREKLQARLMKEVADAETQERKDEAQRIREEVAAELNLNREQVALAFLRFGKQPNGGELAGSFEPFKLDRDSVKESGVSREIRKRLKNLGVYRVEGGQDVDQAANVLGFESGVELLNALAATESFNKAVDAETQKRVDALHPSLMADQAELSDAANEAVRNEQRDEVIAAEMAALARKVREDQQAVGRVAAGAFPPLGMLAKKLLRANESQALAVTQLQDLPLINQLARRAALRNLALLEIRAIRPSVYLAAAKRASAAATNAAASGNYLKALGEKEAELVGHAMYRAARQIQNETEKMQRYLLRMSEDKALARLGKAGASYRDQVQAILERFQLRSTPLVRITERENLKKWIEAQESEGHTVSISDALYDEAFQKDFRTMTFQEFKDVYEAVKQIDKLASLKNKLLKAERDRQFDVFKTEALASMQAGRTAKPVQPQAKSKRERIIGTINGLFQSLRRLTDIVEELDQFKPLGVMFDGIQRPVNDAQNKKDVMVSEATQKLRALYESFTTEERAEMKKRRVVQGVTQNFSLSHEDRICIALNWGNADNRIKLVDGYNGFTEADVEAILDTLTEKDVKFVQAVWDYIDEFWPAIKAKQERVYGIAPEKVEATPWVTKFGVMRGGYYPLKYTGPKAESESAADMAKQMMRGAVGFASTARGHTQARVEGVERPVKIGFEVLHNHVAQVIHDLTHHEMLIDVNRILGDKEIAGTIAGYYSQELLTELKDVVMDIASGGLEKRSPWESVATWLRTRSTVAGMAWNLWTVIQQTYGFTNAIPKVGAKYIARSLNAWVSNAEGLEEFVANIHEKSIFMRNRAKTMDRDISELRNVVEPSKRTALTDSYFYLIGKGQMLADIPTWHAGWLHSKEQLKASDVDAIAFADKLVEDTQGGGAIKAQAKVQRMGGAFFKLWTTFYSYSNALLNQNVQLVKRTEFRDPLSVGRLLVDMSILNTLPLLISMLLRDLLRGDEDKEDPWYAKLAKEQVMSVFGMFPFGREIPGLLEGRKYEGPAGTRLLPEIQKLGVTVKKEVEERGLNPAEWDYDRPLVTSVLRTGGMLFNIPAPALQKAFEGANALWEGTTTNPGVLIVGPTKEERK